MTTENSSPQTDEKTMTLVVQNKMGIHARPAAMIVRVANKHNSELFMEKDDEMVNGKSIMGIMMLAAGQGSKIRAIASGPEADVLLQELADLFQRKFEEA